MKKEYFCYLTSPILISLSDGSKYKVEIITIRLYLFNKFERLGVIDLEILSIVIYMYTVS